MLTPEMPLGGLVQRDLDLGGDFIGAGVRHPPDHERTPFVVEVQDLAVRRAQRDYILWRFMAKGRGTIHVWILAGWSNELDRLALTGYRPADSLYVVLSPATSREVIAAAAPRASALR